MATATNPNRIDYDRLLELNQKVRNNTATQEEKDELMDLLFANGSITQKQYNDYRSGRNVDDLVKAGFIIAGILLLGYALRNMK